MIASTKSRQKASSDFKESLDEVEAYLATDGICTNDLFCSPKIQEPGESGDATDTQGDALKRCQNRVYGGPCQDPEPKVSVLDEDGGECVAPESDEEVVDEMLYQSLMKNSTFRKSRKIVVPEPLISGDCTFF